MSKDALLEVDPSSASLSLVTSAVSSADEANFALALAIFKACPGSRPPSPGAMLVNYTLKFHPKTMFSIESDSFV